MIAYVLVEDVLSKLGVDPSARDVLVLDRERRVVAVMSPWGDEDREFSPRIREVAPIAPVTKAREVAPAPPAPAVEEDEEEEEVEIVPPPPNAPPKVRKATLIGADEKAKIRAIWREDITRRVEDVAAIVAERLAIDVSPSVLMNCKTAMFAANRAARKAEAATVSAPPSIVKAVRVRKLGPGGRLTDDEKEGIRRLWRENYHATELVVYGLVRTKVGVEVSLATLRQYRAPETVDGPAPAPESPPTPPFALIDAGAKVAALWREDMRRKPSTIVVLAQERHGLMIAEKTALRHRPEGEAPPVAIEDDPDVPEGEPTQLEIAYRKREVARRSVAEKGDGGAAGAERRARLETIVPSVV